MIEVVDPDEPNRIVEYGAIGRVRLTTLTKEFFMPRFLGRDEATFECAQGLCGLLRNVAVALVNRRLSWRCPPVRSRTTRVPVADTSSGIPPPGGPFRGARWHSG
jgi:hypothetical protein